MEKITFIIQEILGFFCIGAFLYGLHVENTEKKKGVVKFAQGFWVGTLVSFLIYTFAVVTLLQ